MNDAFSGAQLAQELGLQYRERLDAPTPPQEIKQGDFDRLVGTWAKANGIVPVGEEDGVVLVASSQPLNHQAIRQVQFCYQRPLKLIVTTDDEIERAVNQIRTTLMRSRESNLKYKSDETEEISTDLKIDVTDADDEDAPIIRFVNAIIFKANSSRASDVHIESFEDHVKVRFRIDGRLYDISSEGKNFQNAIISRIKVMAGLNIAEKRLPQDGRISIKIAGKDVDIRVSTIPTQFGERVVMRLLDKTDTVLDLESLGLDGKNLEVVNDLVQKPNGIVLVTGPTGSGKTTTLYACIARINNTDLNILTVEDPIEYQLPGIGQMQVNPKIDFTFASGLRAILRQDPDIVMVGEIRDTETAEIAIQASLTGHLVLSTLHTNDSAGAVTRLIDMKIEPFLVSSSLLAIMAQRLIRKLCPICRQSYELSDEEIVELGVPATRVTSRMAFKRGTDSNCPKCQGIGYSGRSGIHELLVVTEEVRSLISQRVGSTVIKNLAVKQGMETLRMDGFRKILAGITSVEEVLRVTHDDSSE
jgi:general secretion pathway protein E